jgi:hypothetical protein
LGGSYVFYGAGNATLYYPAGNAGWNPTLQTDSVGINTQTNLFGFTITGSNGLAVVVEASTNLAGSVWSPAGTNILSGGSSWFGDTDWTNHPSRFYHLGDVTLGGRPLATWNP